MHLFQSHSEKEYSNLAFIQQFIVHANEFEVTRFDQEKIRQVLFPIEINSMFGIAPVSASLLPSTESLESLIALFIHKGIYKSIVVGVDEPYISFYEGEAVKKLYLKDLPRLRQLYHDYNCFRTTKVRFDSLNFVFSCLRVKNLKWNFLKATNLREISLKGVTVIFVYVYCLSEANLLSMPLEDNCIVVNLHGWNGAQCISQNAYERAATMGVQLMTTERFRAYLNEI